jgi:pantoate--beta-alanine ligase
MGALHVGHARLLAEARRECDCVVASIFVNPLQFGPQEDFQRYPRGLSADLEFCRETGTDLVFAPAVEVMYPRPQVAFVEVGQVSEHLCGRSRPGHFRGVATVVLKLFNLVRPQRAYFGEKDAQQLRVIERMVADLNVPIVVVRVATVREPDGLAVSSRNRYLSAEERLAAPVLYRALQAAQLAVEAGVRNPGAVKAAALGLLDAAPLVRVEYLEVVDADSMLPVEEITEPVRIAAAVWLGATRLIDNVAAAGPALYPRVEPVPAK